jgi:rubrerythrin
MYPDMAKEARKEGFEDIARMFEMIGSVEASHRDRYLKLLKNVEGKTAFKKGKKVSWHCRNCGHVVTGEKAPDQCPVCKHPQAYFEITPANF